MNRTVLMVSLALAAGAVAVPSLALAAPADVTLVPPSGARFLTGQRFDIRVEGKGTGPFSATLTIDGKPADFTSGLQNSKATDGISAAGWGGFNKRGYAFENKGHHHWEEDDDSGSRIHTIVATFTDATGSVTVKSEIETVSVRGERERASNVIIMLGDGMGVAHRTAARLVRYGATQGDPNGWLAMDTFPATGLVSTHSLNSIITDSAPGMACYSTGTHNQNGQEGVYPAHVTNSFYFPRVEYLGEFLHRTQGKVLGLVSTADLEDATPAANAVHTGNRGNGTGIIDQYFDESDAGNDGDHGTGLRVLLGGGRRWFLPNNVFGSSRATGSDYDKLPADLVTAWGIPGTGALDPARDVIADFKNAGFTYDATYADLKKDVLDPRHAPDRLLGLFAYGNMNVALDKLAKRRGVLVPGTKTYAVDDYHAPDQPMLDEMTAAALKVLHKNRDGFVLMVEGAHIDKQAHLMDPERVVDETIEFDRAVGVAKNFAENTDRRTIVIVLADHECSGFSIIGGLAGGIANLKALANDGATNDPAVAPKRQNVVGVYDAAGFPVYKILPDGFPESFDIDGKILFGYGASGDRFENWLTRPRPLIDSLLPNDIKGELKTAGYLGVPVDRSKVDGFFLRGQAVGQDQAVHTASDIPVSAYSARSAIARQFVGVQRNIDVFVKLARAVLGGY